MTLAVAQMTIKRKSTASIQLCKMRHEKSLFKADGSFQPEVRKLVDQLFEKMLRENNALRRERNNLQNILQSLKPIVLRSLDANINMCQELADSISQLTSSQ
jgi:FtsZ-binding cell division protein ZapB